MVTRAVARGSAERVSSSDRGLPANMSQRCLLCIVGILGGFTAMVQGMIVVQTMAVLTPRDFAVYWAAAVLGIWAPAVAIVASVIGLVIRDRSATLMMVLSPIVSIGGYFFYTYGPVGQIFGVS